MLADVSRFATRPPETQRVLADAPVVVTQPTREGGGPFELAPETAVIVALRHRLDLRVAIGRILDSQRGVAVTADRLRADLNLLGSASYGERRTISDASLPNGQLHTNQGTYSVLGVLNLPLERTAERNVFRNSEIEFERAVRTAQQFEDQVKFEVREDLRVLLEARERLQVQQQSLQLAQRRVDITSRFIQVGRASARDVLDAQTDLTDSKNAFSLERMRYRLAELALQRDLDLLQVNEQGLWTELDPKSLGTEGG
jgi:outer membrane protein TolC